MIRFYITILLTIFSFITCGETYIKYDKKTNIESGIIRAKSPTLLLSYSINKEYVLVTTDSDNVKTYYKLSVEDTAPFIDAFKAPITKNLGLLVQDESVLQKSKTISKLEPIEEENLTKLWNGPVLLKIKQANLIPDILSETKSEQLILAREDFHFEKEASPSDKSKLIVSLSVLVYDKSGKLIFASEKSKSTSTYLPDDDLSVANFMGDVLMATFKGKVNVRVNKHCRPILYESTKELWSEIASEIKKKIN